MNKSRPCPYSQGDDVGEEKDTFQEAVPSDDLTVSLRLGGRSSGRTTEGGRGEEKN